MASSLFDVTELGLPAPEPAAHAHSQRVVEAIRSQIETSSDRSITFADFMRAALYEPGLGYYTAGATKLGSAGDFVTAPELTPLFGATIANAFAPIVANGIIELGAGSGALTASILNAKPRTQYRILEVSADLRARQQERLQNESVQWLDALPARIEGLVILNEVLDAIPCEIVRFNQSHYERARVAWRDEKFVFTWQPLLTGALLDAAKLRVPPIEGYISEINLEAEALVATLAERLDKKRSSAICFVDYGFPRREFYMLERTRGTLACHYRHRVHFDPLILPGVQDITSHIDFTAMAEAAVDGGAQVICYATQAKLLLHAGILQQLEAITFTDEKKRIATASAVQKLLSPAEMGELFKVLVVGNESALNTLETLAEIDHSFRL
jgi:SAM-dependent MidA family methyltransferase